MPAFAGMTRSKETPMIEFFFDCSSPWTYLAFHNIRTGRARQGLPLVREALQRRKVRAEGAESAA
jgi:2-hydroxychromene-2-carboxylate isomerase